MEDIEKRLKDATEACLKSHGAWAQNKKDSATRENLMESVHELRKVAARLEIEIAISERDEMAAKPIPIPPHRSQNKRRNFEGDDADDVGNGNGNRAGGGDNGNHQHGGGNRPQHHQGGGGDNGGQGRSLRRKMGMKDPE